MSPNARMDLGGVILDPANECLWRDDERIALRPKVYGVLRYLVANPNRIVTKDELLETIWADTVVGDAVLKVCIRELRAALGDSTQDPRFIATVHRRGYRYVGESAAAPGEPSRPRGLAAEDARRPEQAPSPQRAAGESSTDFVARGFERQHLDAALDAVHAGSRRTVFIVGAPGIGKTTLVDETLRRWGGDGSVRIVRGRCQETSVTKEPFLPFLEAIGALCSEPQDVARLRRIAPTWFVQFPWLLESDDRASLERELHGATSSRMLRELDALLIDLSRERPIVIALEDLHWSDPDSVDLLAFLATRDSSARLMLFATSRSVELIVNDHPLRTVKRDLAGQGRCTELALELFSGEEVEALVRARLGAADLPDGLASWLLARTEGHPLFTAHLVDHLVSARHLTQGSDGGFAAAEPLESLGALLPDSLPAIVEKNVERCSDDERELLEGAALAGYHFSSLAVAHATDIDHEVAERIADGLAARGEFLVVDGASEQPDGTVAARYRFTHALVRDFLTRRLSPSRRIRIQRRLGERGEALFGERAAEIASHLAVHFEEALQYEKGIHYHCIAADNAGRKYASRSAAEHLRNALALVPHLPEARRSEEAVRLEQALARSLRDSGHLDLAAQKFEGLAASQERPEEAAELWLLAASARSWIGRDGCLQNVERALDAASKVTDPAYVAHIHGSAAYWRLLWNGWDSEGRAACEAALEASVAAERQEHACAHRARQSFFLSLESRYGEAAEVGAQAYVNAVELGDASGSLLADFYRGWALHFGGDWSEGEALLVRARDDAANNGHLPWEILFQVQHIWLGIEVHAVQTYLGNATSDEERAASQAAAARAAASALPLANDFISGFAECVLALAAVDAGDVDAARAALAQVERRFADGPFLMDWLCRLVASLSAARCSLLAADAPGALAATEELASRAGAMGEATFAALAAQLSVEARVLEGNRRAARTALKTSLRFVDQAPIAAWRIHAAAADLDRQTKADRAAEHAAAAADAARALLE